MFTFSFHALQLTREVDNALKGNGPSQMDDLAQRLTELGYRVCIRRALGGGEGPVCLHNLRHSFLSVVCPGRDKTSFVVDPCFAEQFKIAKPRPRYDAIMACIPEVLVIPEDKIPPLVTFLCGELSSAFKASGAVIPPWRQASSMLSKWQPRRSTDVPIENRPYINMQHEEQLSDISWNSQHEQISKTGSTAVKLVHLQVASIMEPKRIYGGFGYVNMA